MNRLFLYVFSKFSPAAQSSNSFYSLVLNAFKKIHSRVYGAKMQENSIVFVLNRSSLTSLFTFKKARMGVLYLRKVLFASMSINEQHRHVIFVSRKYRSRNLLLEEMT